TNMGISIGNRGRVDIYVHVKGKATHSSDPESGLSAIEGAYRIMKRLETLKLSKVHPLLGQQRAIVYQIIYDPIAPHTLPGKAKITVDRRLLPGDDPEEAMEEIRSVLTDLAPYEVKVEQGVCMLPSLTAADSPVVLALKEASLHVRGKENETYYGRGTYDAGGLTSAGIPAVMFGASGGSKDILGEDYVCIREVVEEAKMLAYTILKMLI
ncbi:MAG: peptidase dimerization domain-containing protein, partial [Deltaproteobacteria bacterium]|nr:peptidase dimerization domain-containing protein [Deltaproteobacteria bacterium]